MGNAALLMEMFHSMHNCFGDSRWWPGDSPFEVAVGAVLTQNTAWGNVEKAILLLRGNCRLTPRGVWDMPVGLLEQCLRPSGFYRLKTQRLRNLLRYFAAVSGAEAPPDDAGLQFLQGVPTDRLRQQLLNVKGVGPETADSILLYALDRPLFVVDAYTKRMFSRHGLLPEDADYQTMQELFMDALEPSVPLYNEFHALIVRTGKAFCKKQRPACGECPLGGFLEYAVE